MTYVETHVPRNPKSEDSQQPFRNGGLFGGCGATLCTKVTHGRGSCCLSAPGSPKGNVGR